MALCSNTEFYFIEQKYDFIAKKVKIGKKKLPKCLKVDIVLSSFHDAVKEILLIDYL